MSRTQINCCISPDFSFVLADVDLNAGTFDLRCSEGVYHAFVCLNLAGVDKLIAAAQAARKKLAACQNLTP